MGSALRLHPLLVIFGLLAGGELYGLPGILVALPFLAVMRALWEFFGERVQFDSWQGGAVPLELEVERRGRSSPCHRGAARGYRWLRERVSGHAAAAAAAQRRVARRSFARRRLDLDDLVYAALRRPESRAERGAAGARALLGRRPRPARCEELLGARLSAVILFGIPEEKDEEGSGAYDSDGIVQQALRALAAALPGARCSSPTSASASTRRTATAA